MLMMNSFDLLGDVDLEDPSQVVEFFQQKMINSKKSAAPVVAEEEEHGSAARFPPSHAVQERREGYSGPRDGGRGGAGRGRGGSGFGGRNSYTNENSDDYTQNGFELEKDSRNVYDREQGMPSVPGSHKPVCDGQDQSGNPFHRGDCDNRNRWGSVQKRWKYAQPEEKREDLVAEVQEIVSDVKDVEWGDAPADENAVDWGDAPAEKVVDWGDAPASEANKESDESKTNEEKGAEAKKAQEDKEAEAKKAQEDKEAEARKAQEEKEAKYMTLEEYQKVLEEKRKALVAMKAEERKVEFDKLLDKMKLLSLKKGKDEIFVKLGSDKDSGKRKEDADREEKAKKVEAFTHFQLVKEPTLVQDCEFPTVIEFNSKSSEFKLYISHGSIIAALVLVDRQRIFLVGDERYLEGDGNIKLAYGYYNGEYIANKVRTSDSFAMALCGNAVYGKYVFDRMHTMYGRARPSRQALKARMDNEMWLELEDPLYHRPNLLSNCITGFFEYEEDSPPVPHLMRSICFMSEFVSDSEIFYEPIIEHSFPGRPFNFGGSFHELLETYFDYYFRPTLTDVGARNLLRGAVSIAKGACDRFYNNVDNALWNCIGRTMKVVTLSPSTPEERANGVWMHEAVEHHEGYPSPEPLYPADDGHPNPLPIYDWLF